jgi:hypothetical protein
VVQIYWPDPGEIVTCVQKDGPECRSSDTDEGLSNIQNMSSCLLIADVRSTHNGFDRIRRELPSLVTSSVSCRDLVSVPLEASAVGERDIGEPVNQA